MVAPVRASSTKLDAKGLAAQLGSWTTGDGPLYQLIRNGLAGLVGEGVLRDGDILPPERSMAEALDVSRGTVVAAYDRLRDDDIVVRVQGSGTTIRVQGDAIDPAHARPIGDPLFQPLRGSIDLLMAVPTDLERVRHHIRDFELDSTDPILWTSRPEGILTLRTAIAERMTRQGLDTDPEQVLVTAGAQQGVALVVGSVVGPGDVVLTEETTWPGMTDTARRLGARVIGVPMDDHGLIVDELEAAIERFRPALIGLNPHHHNPTGTRLSNARRAAVSDLAARHGVALLEDRVMSGIAFDGQTPPPLASHNPEAVSLTVDSISKTAWPGMRIGWIRADRQSINDLRSSRALADLFSPIPSQLMAVPVVEDLDAILADRVDQLRSRAALLTTLLAEQLPSWRPSPILGGMVCWIELPGGSAAAFARTAARHGVAVATESEFSTSVGTDRHVRVPFCIEEDLLREAVARLAGAWEAHERSGGSAIPESTTII